MDAVYCLLSLPFAFAFCLVAFRFVPRWLVCSFAVGLLTRQEIERKRLAAQGDTWGEYRRKRQKKEGGGKITVKKAKKKQKDWNPFVEDSAEHGKRSHRAHRFELTLPTSRQSCQQSKNAAQAYEKMKERALGKKSHYGEDYSSIKVVGTSQALEKQYTRLTTAADPAMVRPLGVLRKTLVPPSKIFYLIYLISDFYLVWNSLTLTGSSFSGLVK